MKKSKDPISTAALEIVGLEQRQGELAKLSLKKRETAVAQVFMMAGRAQMAGLMEAQGRAMKLLYMKQVKDAKTYRDEFEMTWQQFCDMVGEDRRRVDEELQDLKPFAADWLTKFVTATGIELHKIKYLGQVISANSAKISGNCLIYDGQEIAISPENRDEIQMVLDKIETTYKTDLENAQADAKAAKKIASSKEDVIKKQEKILAKWERNTEGKGLSPEEDAFEQQVEIFQTQFTAYITRIQPDKIEELNTEDNTVTPQMRARYLTLLEWMYMQVKAARDTAEERFGGDLKEAEWKAK